MYDVVILLHLHSLELILRGLDDSCGDTCPHLTNLVRLTLLGFGPVVSDCESSPVFHLPLCFTYAPRLAHLCWISLGSSRQE